MDHSDSESGNPDRIAHTTAFVTQVVELHHEGSIRQPIAPRANALTTELYLAPIVGDESSLIEVTIGVKDIHVCLQNINSTCKAFSVFYMCVMLFCVCVCTYVCMYVYVCVYVCLYLCLYVYIMCV